MTIALKRVELRKVDIKTRMPFRYGIATLTEVPYLLVFADFEIDGQSARGVAADVLPPKWFTKQPEALLEDEIAQMLRVIRTATHTAMQLAEKQNAFRWWQELYQQHMSDTALEGMPSLLKGFGVSLLERAAIDATCHRHETTFHQAVHSNLFGISLEDLHPELVGNDPSQLLPVEPSSAIHVRHTVGLADPLLDSDVADADRLDDGLPQSLEACIRDYGLTYFKIKVPAGLDEARTRLGAIADLLQKAAGDYCFTLDGNEFFGDPQAFRDFWEELSQDQRLAGFFQDRLLVVEQPLHRDVALSPETSEVFNAWPDRPRLIIDESDGELSSLKQALVTGYAGTSHKNCKGIFKGLANACLLSHLNKSNPGKYIHTGEDLMNLGPVALLQDLAVGATLGLTHMERNGHHYVTGLQPMPTEVQRGILAHHADLYHEHESDGERFPTLTICEGAIHLTSINQSPFGYTLPLNAELFDLIESF